MSVFRFIGQVQAMGTAFLVERIINLLLMLIVARSLGAEGFGLYATALSTAGLLEYLMELGLGPVVTRKISQAPELARHWLARALRFKAVLVLVCAALVGFAAPRLGNHPDLPLSAALAVGSFGLFSIGETYAAVLSGLRRFGERGLLLVAYRVMNLVSLSVMLVQGVSSVPMLFLVLTGVGLFYVLGVRYRANRHLSPLEERSTPSRWTNLLREGFPFMTGNMLGAVPLNLPTVAIALGAGLSAAGEFQVAYKLYLALAFVPATVGIVAFSHMAAKVPGDADAAWERFRRGNGLLLLVGVWVGLLLFVLAAPIVRGLFGHGYHNAAALLEIMALGTPFFFLNHTGTQALGAAGRQGRVVWAQLIPAVIIVAGVWISPSPVVLAALLPTVEAIRYLVFSLFIHAEAGRFAPVDWWMAPAALIPSVAAAALSGWATWGAVVASMLFAACIGIFWGRNFQQQPFFPKGSV